MNWLKLVILIQVCFFLNACGGGPAGQGADDNSFSGTSVGEEIQNIESRLNSIEEMKPSLSRLSMIEDDITTLITELNALALSADGTTNKSKENVSDVIEVVSMDDLMGLNDNKEVETPEVSSEPEAIVVETSEATPEPVSPETPNPVAAPEKQTSPRQGYYLHLASYTKKTNLVNGWSEYSRALKSELAGLEPVVEVFSGIAGSTFYRLKAGSFLDKQKAQEVCNLIKTKSHYCIVLGSKGYSLQ